MYEADRTIKAFISVASMTSTAISPDGHTVLYTVSTPNEAFSEYVETLYAAKADGSHTVDVFGDHTTSVSNVQWSPSGRLFAVKTRGLVCVLDAATFQQVAELNVDGELTLYCWGADDSYLWLVSAENEVDPRYPVTVGQFGAPTDIWAVDVASGYAEKIAHESDGMIVDICRSFDGDQLFYAHRANDIYDAANRINIVDRTTRSNTILVPEGSLSVVNFVGCLAGNRAVFAGLDVDPHNASYPRHYYSVSAGNGKVEKLLEPANHRGTGMEAKVFDNGRNILFREADGSNVLLYTLDNLIPKNLVSIEKCITNLSVSDHGRVAFVQQDFHNAPEVFIADMQTLGENFNPKQISTINKAEKEKSLPLTEIIHWQSFDGKTIEGILIYPKNYEPEKQYPLLTLTTGRSNVFARAYLGCPDTLGARDRLPYPLAKLADNGYMILCANCRSSSDYHDYEYFSESGSDVVDGYCRNVLAGIEFVLSKGMADQEMLGVMGWSLGGYIAARLATWPDNHFKVAAIGNGVTDFVSMYETSNCFEFQAFMRGGFWESDAMYDKFAQASPIRHLSNTKAAVLIQHGTKDPSMPVSQGRELYYALRLAGKTVKMTEYPNADHVFMDPLYNLYATDEVFEWVKQHLPARNEVFIRN